MGGVLMPSEKILQQKKEIVSSLAESFKNAQTIILVDYRGLTVQQDTELRVEMRKAGVKYKVIKNRLAKLAFKEIGIEGVDEYLNGPTAVAYSDQDLVAPAKLVCNLAKKFEKLEIKAGIIEGKVATVDDVKKLAELPPREVLIARVLGGFNAPISGLVNVLNANLAGLVRVLNAIAEKQQG